MRRAAKVDANQSQIVETLRAVGVRVAITSSLGGGFPDLVCAVPTKAGYVNVLFEVKDGTQPPSKQRLTPDERRFHEEWRGPLYIVTSEADALQVVRTLS